MGLNAFLLVTIFFCFAQAQNVHRAHTTKPTEISILVVGLVVLLLGVLMSQFWASIIKDNFNKNLSLRPGSKSFQQWKTTPLPLYMKVYFWNWTNAKSVYEADYVPSFSEVGPYVFREVHEKVNLTWNENGTVTFRTIKKWYFEPEMTNRSLSDNITSVNVVAASTSYMTRDLSRFLLYPISVLLRTTGQEISWTKNVSSLLFQGFDNPVQKIGTYFSGSKAMDRFGWFYEKNGTLPDDIFNMGTGTEFVRDLGALKYWNYKNETDYYYDCREVSGSTGEFWPPNNDRHTPLLMYSSDMCRQIRFYFEEESVYNGLQSYTYAGTKDTVDNGSRIKENKCYCDLEKCPPSGVFDVSKCQDGAPIFLSYPHFYNADGFYRNSVRGMNPVRDKHRYYIKIEPKTGVQLEVAARMQINVYLTKNPGLSLFKNITDVFIPVLWLDTHIALGEEFTGGLDVMMNMLHFGPFISYGLMLLGILTVSILALLHFMDLKSLSCVKKNLKKSNHQHEINREENILYSFGDNSKEEVKYVLSEEKL